MKIIQSSPPTIFLKIVGYIIRFIQAGFYTPLILSFTFFIVTLLMLFPDSSTVLLAKFVPEGVYGREEILYLYGKIAFGFAIAISFLEILLKRKLTIEPKKKAKLLVGALAANYSFLFIFLLLETNIEPSFAFTFCLVAFLMLLLPVFLIYRLSLWIELLENFSVLVDKK